MGTVRIAFNTVVASLLATIAIVLVSCGSEEAIEYDLDAAAIGTPLSDALRTGSQSMDDPATWIKFEESVAGCMRESGFEYTIRTVDTQTPLSGIEYGSAEYMSEFALGISTTAFQQDYLPRPLVGSPNAPLTADSLLVANGSILDDMSEEERGAYMHRLLSDEGCIDSAAASTLEGQEKAQDIYLTLQEQMAEELAGVFSRAEADPRAESIDREIVDCVESAGYTVPAGGFGVLLQDLANDIASLHTQSLDNDVDNVLEPNLVSELEELQQLEFGIAESLVACDLSLATINERFIEILQEYEREFVSNNVRQLNQVILGEE
ncbi:MAG: hypothetical protein GY926_21055 [bacterium]|nr:hypothetical protein [bacterium]